MPGPREDLCRKVPSPTGDVWRKNAIFQDSGGDGIGDGAGLAHRIAHPAGEDATRWTGLADLLGAGGVRLARTTRTVEMPAHGHLRPRAARWARRPPELSP